MAHSDPPDLLEGALKKRLLILACAHRHLRAGVQILDPDRCWIEDSVELAAGALIWPDVTLRGNTKIAAGAEVRSGCWLTDTVVSAGAILEPYSVCEGATIGPGARVGPMAHLRPGANLETNVKVGNFVEVKNTILRRGAKASHLTYLGDSEIGEEANIGAGTITCNYDGVNKHRTVIEDDVLIGSDVQLVAPVTVHAGATIGAGATITKDVPAGELTYTEKKQVVIRGWKRPLKIGKR